MSYFCNMKFSARLSIATAITFAAFFACQADKLSAREIPYDGNKPAYSDSVQPSSNTDSLEISLLTCSAGKESYSMFGHTAIRIQDKAEELDYVVNYGVFSFNKSFFILRFIFGLTDYCVATTSFDNFRDEYLSEGRNIVIQRLNLSVEDKLMIVRAIQENLLPQNAVYRYNFFYDNCTTRARDILIDNIGSGVVEYGQRDKRHTTYRKMVHQWNTDSRWLRFGEDLLLGMNADTTLSFVARHFLPDSLRISFQDAQIVDKDGVSRALVDSAYTISSMTATIEDGPTVVTPFAVSLAILVLTIVITTLENRRKRILWLYDFLLFLVSGLAGLILFAMIFSQHPTVSLNLQILLLNPLNLIFGFKAAKCQGKGKYSKYYSFLAICLVIFFIGAFRQVYAEGMLCLALSLLIRCGVNISKVKQKQPLPHE